MAMPSLCRLCLYNIADCVDLATHNPDELREKMAKFLNIDINDNDPLPKTVCQKCIHRLELFHEFYQEVAQNQEMLQYAQPATIGDQQIIITNELTKSNANYIQLPYGFKGVVTLQAVGNAFDLDADDDGIDLRGFVPNVSQDEIDVGGLLTKDGDEFETIEVIDMPTSSKLIEIDASMVVLDDELDKESPLFTTVSSHSMVKKEIVENMGSNNVNVSAEMSCSSQVDATAKSPKLQDLLVDKKEVISIACGISDDDSLRIDSEELELNESDDSDIDDGVDDEVIDDDDDDGEDEDTKEWTGSECAFLREPHEAVNGIELQKERRRRYAHDSRDNDKFAGFPKSIIKDSKLIIRGKPLLELMSRFYRLECDLCPVFRNRPKFDRLHSLCQHYVQEHSIKGYVICCGTKLVKMRAMAMHMARHLQPEAFTCPECDKMLTCPKILQYHMQNHLPEAERPLACRDCPRKFSYSSALVAHAISHQPESERAAHVCDECGKVFVSAGRLTTHINVTHTLHGQDYICHICAKQFACRNNLTYHLTTHQPKVHQVQCEKCGKWLKNKLCLRKHMVQHSTVRYNCTQCNYSALNRQCLRNHVKVQHSDLKPFSCEVCGKSFKLKNTLTAHMVQHTGVRKFACPFCNRTFASSGNYYTHRKRMHPLELAAMKQKQEDDERKLREQVLKTANNK